MTPLQLGAMSRAAGLGIAGVVALVVVLAIGGYVLFRRVEDDAEAARRRTEQTSRKAAGGLVAAGLAVLGALTGVFDEVANGLGEAVMLVGMPGGETVASAAVGTFVAYALGMAADLPVTTALVAGLVVFGVALGVTRA